MIWGLCGPRGVFSLINWLFINQFGHDAYQIEAEYVSLNGIIYITVDKELENIISKEYKISHFLKFYFFKFE